MRLAWNLLLILAIGAWSPTFTWAQPPIQALSILFTSITPTSVQVSFVAGLGSAGSVVLARQGVVPAELPTNGIEYVGANPVFGAGTLVATSTYAIYSGSGTSVAVTGLTPGTTYSFRVCAYDGSGAGTQYNMSDAVLNPASVNIPLGSYTSLIQTPAGYPFIASTATSLGSKVDVFSFMIQDAGDDSNPTRIDEMHFQQGGGNDVPDWTQVIGGFELRDNFGHSQTSGSIMNASIKVLPIPNSGSASGSSLGAVGDGGVKVYTLSIWLKTNLGSLQTTIDNLNLTFMIGSTFILTPVGANSGILPGQSAESGSTNGRINVAATKLIFQQQPTATFASATMSPTVTVVALDVNNNYDLDFNNPTFLQSTGLLVGSPSATFSSAIGSYSDIIHNAAGTGLVLTATSSGLTNGSSSSFNILAPSNGSDIAGTIGFSYPANIAYNTYQASDITFANSIEVAQLDLRDGGASLSDADPLPTMLTGITMSIANAAAVRRVALYDGSTEILEAAPSGGSVTLLGGGLSAPDNSLKMFSVRITFNSVVTDNSQVGFTVTAAVASLLSSSSFAAANGGGFASSTTGDNNRIEVTATKLEFTTQPPAVILPSVNVSPRPVFEARDALNNRDQDYTAAFTVNNLSSLTMINVPTAGNWALGVVQFPSNFQYTTFNTTPPNATLTVASGSLTSAVSIPVYVDGTAPTVILSDNHPDNIVKDADNVTITATFTEADQIDEVTPPRISISGAGITNAAMTKTSNLVWTYSWNVPVGNFTGNVTIAATDRAGNANTAATGKTSYIVDNTAPSVVLTHDQTDNIVRDADNVLITATFTEANGIDEGAPPKISISGTAVTNVSMSKTSNLVWTYTWNVPVGDFNAAVSISATDVAGNANSGATGTTSYSVDNTVPVLGGSPFLPVAGKLSVPVGANLSITLNENVRKPSGPGANFIIRETLSQTIFETIDASGPQVTPSGSTITINPTSSLSAGVSYFVEVNSGAILDIAGNPYSGFSGSTSWNFQSFSAPVLSGDAIVETTGTTAACVGTQVTINGQFFTGYTSTLGITQVQFCEITSGACTNGVSVTYVSDSQLTVTIPPGFDERIKVKVYTSGDVTALGTNAATSSAFSADNADVGASSAVIALSNVSENAVCSSGATAQNIKVTLAGGTSPSWSFDYLVNGSLPGAVTGYTSGSAVAMDPPVAGTNTYTLTSVTDSFGCASPDNSGTAVITEHTLSTITINSTNPLIPVCLFSNPAFIDINGEIQGSNTSGTYSTTNGTDTFDSGGGVSGTHTLRYNFSAPDLLLPTLTLRLTTGANAPCVAVTQDINVTFTITQSANLGGNTSICKAPSGATTVSLTGTLTGDATSGTWEALDAVSDQVISSPDFSNGTSTNASGGQVSNTYTFRSADITNGAVKIRVMPVGGCGSPISDLITVSLKPFPDPVASSGNVLNDIYASDQGNFSVVNTAGSSYQWTAVGATINSGNGTNAVNVTWTNSGNQTLTVVETNSVGCASVPLDITAAVASDPTLVKPTAIPPTPPAEITQTSFLAKWNPVTGATQYALDVSTDDFATFVTDYDNRLVTDTSTDVVSLEPGTRYKFRVRSIRVNTSPSSDPVSVLTKPANPVITTPAVSVTTSGFTARWNDVQSASDYFIDVSLEADNFNSFVTGFNNKQITGATQAQVTGLSAGTTYLYRVRARNTSGESFNSDPAGSQITVPLPPATLTTDQVLGNSFLAAWSASQGAVSYELEVSKDNFQTFVANYGPKVVVEATDEIVLGLTALTLYRFRVRANNAGGVSANSPSKGAFTDNTNSYKAATIEVVPGSPTAAIVKSQTKDGVSMTTNVVTLFHRKTAETLFTPEAPFTLTSDNYDVPVNPAWLDEIGMEYYFKVVDALDAEDESGHAFIYKIIAQQSVPNLVAGGTISTYSIFSIPVDLSDKSVTSIFEPLIIKYGGYLKDKWRLLHYQSGRNVDYDGDEFREIGLGRSYWFNSVDKVDIKVTAGPVVASNQSDPFKLQLEKGWNQVGNPFTFNIDWSDVRLANPSALVDQEMFVFDRKSSFAQSDKLIAWSGGFVYANENLTLNFPPTLKNTAGSRKTSGGIQSSALDQPEWFVPVTVTHGVAENNYSGFGMHPQASLSKDGFDSQTVPRFIKYLEMNSYHEEAFTPRFSKDVVPTAGTYTWTFTVESNFDEREVELSWDNVALGNNPAQLFLYDEAGQSIIDMKGSDRYTFEIKEKRRFKIFFGKDVRSLRPDISGMGIAFPNPFTTAVTIPFIVGSESPHVQIAVYDLMGKHVKDIVNKDFPPGYHEALWDGTGGQGEHAARGIYIYRMVTSAGVHPWVGRVVMK